MKRQKSNRFYVLSIILIAVLLIFWPWDISLAQTDAVKISVGSASNVSPGSSVDLDISIDPDDSFQKPASAQFDIVYNSSYITSIIWKSDGPAATSAGKSANCSAISSGIYRCLIMGFNENAIPKGVLGTVTVAVSGGTSASSIPINLSNLYSANAAGQSIPITGTGGTITIKSSSENLSVTCKPNISTTFVGKTIRWTARARGGSGYTYSWSGSDGLSGDKYYVSKVYETVGQKTASVSVTSGSETVTTQCSSAVEVKEPWVTGRCGVSVSPLSTGETNIRWSSNMRTPVSTDIQYEWSGTDGLSSDKSYVTKTYSSGGTKNGFVNMSSGSQSVNLTCSANINTSVSESPLGGQCIPSVSGMRVTWAASGRGGTGEYSYSWSGPEGLSATTSRITKTYSTEGTKIGIVNIQSGNDSLTLNCQVKTAETSSRSSGSSEGGCFIATAAFGTEMEPGVIILKNFRDETLLQNNLGRLFVDAYYKISPPLADFISDKEVLRVIIRAGLNPLIFGLEKLDYDY